MTPQNEPTVTALTAQPAQQPPARVPLNEMLALVRDTELVATYGREIIESQLAINRFDQDWRMAMVFSKSGLFADAQEVNQAMTKVQLGRSWNMSPADAMQHVYFVNGKPSVQNEYLGAKMRDAGLDWDIEWHREKDGLCIGVTLWPRRLFADGWKPIMERKDGKEIPASVSFTRADADRVKVKEDGKYIKLSEKSTYQSFPDDMYFWRAIARLRRRYATNILSGVLTRDEADEIAPPAVEVPREKMAVVEPIVSGRQSRKKAGAEEIPGTGKEAPTGEKSEPMFGHPDLEPPAKPAAPIEEKKAPAKPEPETKPATTETKPAATAPAPPADRPWANHGEFTAAFQAIHRAIGTPAWTEHFNEFQKDNPSAVFGPESYRDDVVIAFYRKLQALLPAAPAEPEKKKLFG